MPPKLNASAKAWTPSAFASEFVPRSAPASPATAPTPAPASSTPLKKLNATAKEWTPSTTAAVFVPGAYAFTAPAPAPTPAMNGNSAARAEEEAAKAAAKAKEDVAKAKEDVAKAKEDAEASAAAAAAAEQTEKEKKEKEQEEREKRAADEKRKSEKRAREMEKQSERERERDREKEERQQQRQMLREQEAKAKREREAATETADKQDGGMANMILKSRGSSGSSAGRPRLGPGGSLGKLSSNNRPRGSSLSGPPLSSSSTSSSYSSTSAHKSGDSTESSSSPAGGKKTLRIYSREFLLGFQDRFTDKPTGLPDMDSIIGRNNNSPRGGGGSRNNQQQGQDEWRGNNRRNDRGNNRSNDRRRQHGGHNNGNRRHRGQDAPMDIVIKPLTTSENRYTIQKDIEGDKKVLRDLNAILNKLTPEKFDTLMQRVLDMKIESFELLKSIVSSVFEKALSEPAFCPTYAEFCKHLSSKLPEFVDPESGRTQTFKRMILNQCQLEFENSSLKKDSTPDEEKKEAAKKKQRMMGTMRFIGELFMRKMLTSSILKSCLSILMGDVNNPVDENIEALNKLLLTVGKTLDVPSERKFVENMFDKITVLAKSKTLGTRMRFMCKDTLDLRRNRWVLRDGQKKETAKKISEVHKEAAKKSEKKGRDRDSKPSSRGMSLGSGDIRSSNTGRKKRGKNRYDIDFGKGTPKKERPQMGADGFTSVGGRGGRSPSHKDRSNKSESAWSSPSRKVVAGRGTIASRMADKKTEDKSGKPKTYAANAFSAFSMLGDDEDEDEDKEEPEKEEEKDEGGVDEETATKKIKSMLKEWFTATDKSELCLCMDELETKRHNHLLVFEGLLLVVEMREAQVVAVAQAISYLLTKDYVTSKQCQKGMDEMMMMVPDLLIDIPLALQHTGTVLGGLVAGGCLEASYVNSDAVKPLIGNGSAAKLAVSMIQAMEKLEAGSGKKAAASVDLNALMPSDASQGRKHFERAGLESLLE